MAPRKPSQTPRQQGLNDHQHSLSPPTHHDFSHQADSTVTNDKVSATSRRRLKREHQGEAVASSGSSNYHDLAQSPPEISHSRRESTSTMRTSSVSLEGGPACTPTGRISKAKKGKRVHACEFPGCEKVCVFQGRRPQCPTPLQQTPD
jgi:hypothetical protein